VTLPYPARHEEMWRADGLYDVVIVIGYNTDPVVPGAGSAIFLHVARPDMAPTEGCIAVERSVLVRLLPMLEPGSKITIAA
jgi:L,D-peptidoglycan transpeptidase YkuD (ErfK/YbiS/YcfS/YnhG family)